MSIRWLPTVLLAVLPATAVLAQTSQAPVKQQATSAAESAAEPIYGHQLMTDAERVAYRAKMRALRTQAERDAFRLEHHKLMQARAKEKGLTLPEAPPCPRMGEGRMERPCMDGKSGPHGPPPRNSR